MKSIKIYWTPAPRLIVGELIESRHEPAPCLDSVRREASSQHLSLPAAHHRSEDHLIGAQQRNILETRNPRRWCSRKPHAAYLGVAVVADGPWRSGISDAAQGLCVAMEDHCYPAQD
ncbi:hypothetical protein [Mycobacterium deserti]|uniref:Uncharacterized protein n=1 Tax=Mycobacterium deserti TaxID=2978347 RepID=A0ABT2M6X8_9MYCO|nr:hypothetical protein [Mycobacterium deserti]MCT7658007.1 hypothetical protein [Mycobacterium deserti]